MTPIDMPRVWLDIKQLCLLHSNFYDQFDFFYFSNCIIYLSDRNVKYSIELCKCEKIVCFYSLLLIHGLWNVEDIKMSKQKSYINRQTCGHGFRKRSTSIYHRGQTEPTQKWTQECKYVAPAVLRRVMVKLQ